MADTADGSALRRAPVQSRSSRRVDRIVEECALALEEVGYDGITTSMLAERAGMSVGGLYRFFESKQAVVAELRRRRLAEFLVRASEQVRDMPAECDWVDVAISLIDTFAEMRRTVPGSGVVQLSSMSMAAGLPRDPEEDRRSAEVLAEVLAERLATPADDAFKRSVLVAYVVGDALCSQAFRLDPNGDEMMLDQARALVSAYLRGEVGGTGADMPASAVASGG